MNDRFKFRAWNTMTKTMKEIAQLTFDKDTVQSRCYDKNKTTLHLLFQKHIILMQCTGLKDKNGKLIYEGDVVKYTDCEGRETVGSLEVDRFNLLTFTDMVTCDFCEEWSDVVKAVFFTGNSTIEVIGNIYENKELLGEKK